MTEGRSHHSGGEAEEPCGHGGQPAKEWGGRAPTGETGGHPSAGSSYGARDDQSTPADASIGAAGRVSQKSFVTTWLLALFLGLCGADRFYLGHTVLGVVKLVTCGGCGFWWLIDQILHVSGSTRDDDGLPLRGRERHATAAWVITGIVIVMYLAAFVYGLTQQNESPVPADCG